MTLTDTIPSPLRQQLEQHGHEPAVIVGNVTRTWREVALAVGAAKGWLVKNGFRRGDSVALVPKGTLEEVVLFLACCETGVTFCGLNRHWPVRVIRHQAQNIGARLIGTQETVIASDFRQSASLNDIWHLQQPVSIIFTSGSTGSPKAVVHTLGNHYFNALGSNENIKMEPGGRWQLSLPLYHVSGMGIVFRTLLAGAAMVISEGLDIPALRKNRVTHLSLVSTQFRRLLDDPVFEELGSQLDAILLGGGPLPQKLLNDGQELGLPLFVSYGLSEMTSQVATSTPNQADLSTATVLPYRQVKISADDEILVRGETLFAGYLHEDGIDSARDRDGWFHTRDAGQLDENRLRVTGRLDNQFISGGENIQPEIIERALEQIPGIHQAVVVPVPEAEFGQRPFAFYAGGTYVTTPFNAELSKILPTYMLPIGYAQLPVEIQQGIKPDRQKLVEVAGQIMAGQ